LDPSVAGQVCRSVHVVSERVNEYFRRKGVALHGGKQGLTNALSAKFMKQLAWDCIFIRRGKLGTLK
jgi:hypothetical protein